MLSEATVPSGLNCEVKTMNMKKILSLLLALLMVCALCACSGGNVPAPSKEPAPTETVKPTATPEPSPEPLSIPLSDGAEIGKVGVGREVYKYLMRTVSRLYYYYIPSTYQEGDRLPLMFSLHGSGSSARMHMEETQWVKFAEENNFIVVVPESVIIHKDGSISSEGLGVYQTKQTDYNYIRWNAAASDPVSFYRVDDVQYISDLIDIFVEAGYADPARVYSSGMSHGGFLSLKLALEIPEKIAGVGIVSSQLVAEYASKKLPVGPKVVFLHGTKDNTCGYDGMIYDLDGDGVLEYLWAYSLEDSVKFFLNQYGMENNPIVSDLPDIAEDGTSITRYEYDDAEGVAKVVSYVIENGGHTWPGGNMDYGYFGLSSKDAQGAELIWAELKDVVNTLQ